MEKKLAKDYITEGLFILMEKKDYKDITITDITNKAGVNRITFYRNFDSKDEIINKYLEKSFDKWGHEWEESGDQNIAYRLFKYFSDNKKFIKILYKSNLQFFIIDYLVKICNPSKEENNVIAYSKSMFVYGLFGFCNEWYLRGMPESPRDISALLNNNQKEN